MSTVLFDKIVFGPIKSRRLGISLGINLLPIDSKLCSFDCIYCECGFSKRDKSTKMPTREEVKFALRSKLSELKSNGTEPDVITFAGNGEPTLHPEFEEIIEDTISLRDAYFPKAKISVLSNATMIAKPMVFEALNKVDNNILKLDSAIESTIYLMDKPHNMKFSLSETIRHLKKFDSKFILQTMFLRGSVDGQTIDNTTEEEINAWIKVIKEIKPKEIMIYSIDRETPLNTLQKISHEELEFIAKKVRQEGFFVSVA